MRGTSRNLAEAIPRLTVISAPLNASSRKSGNCEQRDRARPFAEIDDHGNEDREIMREDDRPAPDEAKDIQQIGKPNLLDIAFGARKNFSGTLQDGADETPDQKPDAHIGHQLPDRHLQYLRIHNAQRDDGHRGVRGEPERSQKGSAIPVENVVPAEPGPRAAKAQSHQQGPWRRAAAGWADCLVRTREAAFQAGTAILDGR